MRAAKTDNNKLTPAQERYCRNRAAGMVQADAYRKANKGSQASKKSQCEIASRQERLQKIQDRIAELREQAAAGAIMQAQEIQAELAGMAADTSRPDGVRLKALDQLTRMQGGYNDALRVSAGLTVDDRAAALADILPPPAGS